MVECDLKRLICLVMRCERMRYEKHARDIIKLLRMRYKGIGYGEGM